MMSKCYVSFYNQNFFSFFFFWDRNYIYVVLIPEVHKIFLEYSALSSTKWCGETPKSYNRMNTMHWSTQKKKVNCRILLQREGRHSMDRKLLVSHFDTKVPERLHVASWDSISSSAHHSGDSLGVACSGVTFITCLNLEVTSFILGLCFGSFRVHSFMTSQMTSSSLSLKDESAGSTILLRLSLSFK